MKKIALLLSAVLLALCILPAGAQTLTLLAPESEYSYIDMQSACIVGDSAYFLACDNGIACLYRWQPGMAQEEVMIADLDLSANRLGMAEAFPDTAVPDPGATVPAPYFPTFSFLFTDGGQLLSLDLLSGRVFSTKLVDYEQVYEDLITLDSVDLFLHLDGELVYFPGVSGAAVTGNRLLAFIQDWNSEGYEDNRIVIADLSTGAVTASSLRNVKALCQGPDGQALVVIQDDLTSGHEDGTIDSPVLCLYDPASDTAAPLGSLPVEYLTGAIGYSPMLNAMVFLDNNRILACSLADGSTRQVGFLTGSVSSRCSLLCMEDLVIIPGWSGIVIRSVSDHFSSDHSLTLYGAWNDEGRALFSARHPDVPVYDTSTYYSTVSALRQAMAAGKDAPDVLVLDVSYSTFLSLRDQGACADLSAWPDITSAVGRMYPLFRDAVTDPQGRLVAVPLSATSTGWSVHNAVLTQLGLTMADIPTNYVDLCAFINHFNDDLAPEHDDLTLFDNTDSLKEYLFSQAMKDYLDWCNATGRPLTFNTPEFRAVMTAIEGLHTDNLRQNDWEHEVYYFNLFALGTPVVGTFSTDNEYITFLPMTLTPDTGFFTAVDLRVMFINPNTPHMDLSAEMLACELEALSGTGRHVLFTDETAPVINPRYEEMVAVEQAYIASLQEQLAAGDESVRPLLTFEQDYLDQNAGYWRYEIAPDAIDHYLNDLVPRMTLARPTFLTSDPEGEVAELNTLFARYLAGQISLDQFIREADNRIAVNQMGR